MIGREGRRALATPASAARPGRDKLRQSGPGPKRTKARLTPISGTTSQTVASPTRSRYSAQIRLGDAALCVKAALAQMRG